jgi:hypothetical protein
VHDATRRGRHEWRRRREPQCQRRLLTRLHDRRTSRRQHMLMQDRLELRVHGWMRCLRSCEPRRLLLSRSTEERREWWTSTSGLLRLHRLLERSRLLWLLLPVHGRSASLPVVW